jgi:hypothetical protein
MPRIKPAIIASHGKPGIAGSIIGVVTETVVALLVVVGVLTTVSVETDVLTTVVVSELVVVTGVVETLDDVELVTEVGVVAVVTTLELELEVELELVVVVTCCPTTGGIVGSRWNIPDRPLVPVLGGAPTAHPSVGLVVKTEYKPNPLATGVGKFRSVQPPPFHHAVTSLPEHVGFVAVRATLQPTAHPSPLPEGVPYVSTCTDVHAAAAGALAALPTTQLIPSVVDMIVFADPTIQPSLEFAK